MKNLKKDLSNCLSYLNNNASLFSLDPDEYRNEFIKPFIELVFCYNMLPEFISNTNEFDFLRGFIFNEIDKGNFLSKLENNFNALAGMCVLEEFLLKNGESRFQKILKYYVEENKMDLKYERTPFRLLDTKYSLGKAQIKDNLPSYENLFKKTVLGKGLSIYYLRPMTTYSITHTIFYLTDMGRRKTYNNLIYPKMDLLEKLIMECIVKHDLDILGELILCCFFLEPEKNLELSRTLKLGCQFILENQDIDGSFPAPIDHDFKNKKKRFEERYHTTLVCMGVLAWLHTKENY